jgi:hypothetical protein
VVLGSEDVDGSETFAQSHLDIGEIQVLCNATTPITFLMKHTACLNKNEWLGISIRTQSQWFYIPTKLVYKPH